MVSRGQFLERPTLITVGDLVLEGLSHRGEARPPLLIVPPPPSEGSMDHVVAAEIAWAAAQAGHQTLRFNFRGVGASQGKPGDETTHRQDTEAALRVLQENADVTACAVVAIGSSAPVLNALARGRPAIAGAALVSPREHDPAAWLRLGLPLLVIVGAKDTSQPRAALAASVTEAGGTLELIEDADSTFLRNLPQVGRALAQWLAGLRV